jgi:hypothetical protein
MVCRVFQTLVIRGFSHGLYITSMDVQYFTGDSNLQLYIYKFSKYRVTRTHCHRAMDLHFLLNHTTPNAPPPASPNTIAAPTPPPANTNYVANRAEPWNTDSGSQAQKPSPRTNYPRLAPAPRPPAPTPAHAHAFTANVFSTSFAGFYSAAPEIQPRVPSPPHPWASDSDVHPPLTASGTDSTKTRAVDHRDGRTFSHQLSMTESSYQQVHRAESITKPSIPKPNNITVDAGSPDDEATRNSKDKKRKRGYENEDAMSKVVDSEIDKYPDLSCDLVGELGMGYETTYGPEAKRRKNFKDQGKEDGGTSDGPSKSAFPHLGADHPVPQKALTLNESNPTFPPAKKAKRNSERKAKKGTKKLGVKILAKTENVEKNGWACFQRVKG